MKRAFGLISNMEATNKRNGSKGQTYTLLVISFRSAVLMHQLGIII